MFVFSPSYSRFLSFRPLSCSPPHSLSFAFRLFHRNPLFLIRVPRFHPRSIFLSMNFLSSLSLLSLPFSLLLPLFLCISLSSIPKSSRDLSLLFSFLSGLLSLFSAFLSRSHLVYLSILHPPWSIVNLFFLPQSPAIYSLLSHTLSLLPLSIPLFSHSLSIYFP